MHKKAILLGAALVLLFGGFIALRTWRGSKADELARVAMAKAAGDHLAAYLAAEAMLSRAVQMRDTPERQARLAWIQAMTALRGGPANLWDAVDRRLVPLERAPARPALAYAARGLWALSQKRAGDAILEVGRGMAVDPLPELLWVRARAEWMLEKPGEALRTLEILLQRSADFLPALADKARLLRDRGKRREAAQAMTEVVRRSPDHAGLVQLAVWTVEDAQKDGRRGAFDEVLALTSCAQLAQAVLDHAAAGGKPPGAAFTEMMAQACGTQP